MKDRPRPDEYIKCTSLPNNSWGIRWLYRGFKKGVRYKNLKTDAKVYITSSRKNGTITWVSKKYFAIDYEYYCERIGIE